MSHIFRIGDRCRAASQSHIFDEFKGQEFLYQGPYTDPRGRDVDCLVMLVSTSKMYVAASEDLIPLNPPKSQISEILAMKPADFQIAAWEYV